MGHAHPYLNEGVLIHRGVFTPAEVEALRTACDTVAAEAGTTCVRRIRAKSPELHKLANDSRLLDRIPPGFQVVRSILFDKTPDENWPVAWHQDLTIAVTQQMDLTGYGPWSIKDGTIHVQPPEEVLKSMLTLRIHLDETPASNGALRIVPGSHLHRQPTIENPEAREVVCECHPGDVLAMSPLILHASSRSMIPSRRRIIHFEYADPSALHPLLDWSEAQ